MRTAHVLADGPLKFGKLGTQAEVGSREDVEHGLAILVCDIWPGEWDAKLGGHRQFPVFRKRRWSSGTVDRIFVIRSAARPSPYGFSKCWIDFRKTGDRARSIALSITRRFAGTFRTLAACSRPR